MNEWCGPDLPIKIEARNHDWRGLAFVFHEWLPRTACFADEPSLAKGAIDDETIDLSKP